jgi:hypothetical protein
MDVIGRRHASPNVIITAHRAVLGREAIARIAATPRVDTADFDGGAGNAEGRVTGGIVRRDDDGPIGDRPGHRHAVPALAALRPRIGSEAEGRSSLT